MTADQVVDHPPWCDCAHVSRPPGGWNKHGRTLLADELEVDWNLGWTVVRLEQADTEAGLLPVAVRLELDGEGIYLAVDAAAAIGRALLDAAGTMAREAPGG